MSLNYCVKLLKDREPKEGYREVVQEKDILHNERMKEKVVDDIEELPIEVFNKTLNILKNKYSKKYEFITKAGSSLHLALFKLFQVI